MKKIRLEIKNHSDRMDIVKALAENGYEVKVTNDTQYLTPRCYVEVRVADSEVLDV